MRRRSFPLPIAALFGRVGGRCVLAAFVALVAYAAFFPFARPLTIDIGSAADRFVIANWNRDERDADVTYRWTTMRSVVRIPGYGGVRDAHVEVTARNGRGQRIEAAYTLDLGGAPARLGSGENWVTALADARAPGSGADLAVTLSADRFDPKNGDSRSLGVQVDRLVIEPQQSEWWRGAVGGLPWAAQLMLLAAAVALVVPRQDSGLLGGTVAGAVALLALVAPETRLVLPPLLLPAAVGTLVIGAVVRWRRTSALLGAVWDSLDHPRVSRAVVALLIVGYVVGVSLVIARVDFIGHADYADTAVRARNIVRGRGDTVDYVAQFYTDWPTVSHPADTWPPLQVWLVAAAFRIVGISTAVAKLPNVAVMAALLALIAWVGAWRWNRRVGVLAAAFLAGNVFFFAGTLAPQNDLVFTLLFAVFAVTLYRAWCDSRPPALLARAHLRASIAALLVSDAAVGVTAGLLVLAKPVGAVLAAGAGIVALVVARRGGRHVPMRSVGVAAVAAAICYAPWGIRNLVQFGSPLYSTESLDAWVNKYDPAQPTEGIYRYFTRMALPHPRLLIGYGLDHFLAVQGREWARLWAAITAGMVVSLVLIALAILGALIGSGRRSGFGAVIAGAFVPYTVFLLVYWHFEARYFLVAVPWACLWAAAGLDWLYDALAAWFAGRWQRALVPVAVLAVLAVVFLPAASVFSKEIAEQTGGNEAVQIARWVRDNTPPDAVVMTRNPWELSWHSERRAVMLPLGTSDDIEAAMRQYGVTVLVLDHINDCGTVRRSIAPLYQWQEIPGVTRLYNPNPTGYASYLIYAVNPAALRPLPPQPAGCGIT